MSTREQKIADEIRRACNVTGDITVTIDAQNETIHATVNGDEYCASDASEFETLDFANSEGAYAFTCNNPDRHLAPSTRR